MQCKVQYWLPHTRGCRFRRCAFAKASCQVIAGRLVLGHLTLDSI